MNDMPNLTKKERVDRILDNLEGAIDFKGSASELLHKLKKEI